MSKKQIEEKKEQEEDLKDLTFIEKFKKSKKFRAKLELIGYGIFILIIIILVNVSSLNTTNYDYSQKNPNTIKEEKITYKSIKDNYNANISVLATNKDTTYNREYQIEKNSDNNIIKKLDTNKEYKITDTEEFYTIDNTVAEEKEIFDLIPYKYLNTDNIKKYLEKGKVDYTTKYSSGVELTSYKVMVRDILLDNTTEDYITINVTTEKDKLTMDIDYTNLLKSESIDTCNVKIIYTNITDAN